MVIIGVLAAAVVIYIISRWWADGLISATELLLLSAIYGGLVFGLFAVSGKDGIGAALFVLLPLLGSVGWALYCNQKLGIRQYYKEKIRTYDLAIQADPRNTAARSMMAEAYYALGDLDSAIAAMELAVQIPSCGLKESHKLRQWQEERELRDSKTVVCQLCHSRNLWGSTLCRTCRQPLVYPAPKRWHQFEALRRHSAYIAIGNIWLILSIVSFLVLAPGQAGIVVLCGTLAAAGWVMLSSSKA